MLNDFETFIEEFNAIIGNSNKERMLSIKIQLLCQGSRLIMVYALEFRQLICDISWGEAAFINEFQFGLRGDVKDLLLTLLNLSTLSEAITQVVQCDNKFFEHQQKRCHESTKEVSSTKQRNFAQPTTQKNFSPIMPT